MSREGPGSSARAPSHSCRAITTMSLPATRPFEVGRSQPNLRPMANVPRHARPFLRWAGGKRWLAPAIRALVADLSPRHYFEPFLGGGAIFFTLRPKRASLSDINEDLINTYVQVRDQADNVTALLREMPVSKEGYERIRSTQATDPAARAARFLYLNRTAFLGLYRVNRDGAFNVPYGGGERTPKVLYNTAILQEAARALEGAALKSSDFEESIAQAQDGDLVYCDPTYTVLHNSNGFLRYNEAIFSWDDQVRLATASAAASKRGALVIVSNADHPTVSALYPSSIRLRFERFSLVSPRTDGRKVISEALYVMAPELSRARLRIPVDGAGPRQGETGYK